MNILVTDFNVIYSAALGVGHSYRIFEINNIERKFKFLAPEYMDIEITTHTDELARKTRFSINEVQEVLQFILKQITFVADEEFKHKIPEALKILKGNKKDIPYLALALAKNCDILSGDKKFKELCPDKVKTPREILEIFEDVDD